MTTHVIGKRQRSFTFSHRHRLHVPSGIWAGCRQSATGNGEAGNGLVVLRQKAKYDLTIVSENRIVENKKSCWFEAIAIRLEAVAK